MPPKNGMQRVLYRGVPVWVNEAQEMYMYTGNEPPTVKIGDTRGFLENWKDIYKTQLDSFRSTLEPRSRSKKI
jgi:hypothetical protein